VRGAAKKRKARTQPEECLAWLDAEPEGWTSFLDAVEWSFDAPNLPAIRQEISNRLALRADARALPAEILGDRDLLEAWRSAEPANLADGGLSTMSDKIYYVNQLAPWHCPGRSGTSLGASWLT